MKQLVLLIAALAAQAQAAEAADLRFVACPIYRDVDAGKKSGCWLATDPATGIRYDVSAAPAKPDWNFSVLVEGRPTDATQSACGGVVLDPVRTSILTTPCTRHMLPAEDFTGHPFVLPRRNVRPSTEAQPVPPPPYSDTTFHLFFEHDRSFSIYQLDDWLLDRANAWLQAAQPAHIIVTGYAVVGQEPVSGVPIGERPEVAHERADMVVEALIRLGFPRDRITEVTGMNPAPTAAEGSDGLADASRRRVDLLAVVH